MRLTEKTSPNQNERKDGIKPFMLILHYTGTKSAEEADAIYMTLDKVSPHYMIDINSNITKYVDEEKRSWHAGLSSWDGYQDINSTSIGIEVVNAGHEGGLPGFPDIQVSGLIELIQGIRSRWDIPDHYILGHSDIAPGRKIDPGEKFPWQKLAEAGIGLMPRNNLSSGDIDTKIEFFSSLKEWGYDYTDDLDLIINEFRRHYLPENFGQRIEDQILHAAIYSLFEQKKLTHP